MSLYMTSHGLAVAALNDVVVRLRTVLSNGTTPSTCLPISSGNSATDSNG